MSLIPIKLLCNRRPKSSSGSGSGSSSSGSGTTTNSVATNDWFYFDNTENSVHCKYPLVGDSEVSAFGYGSSSGSGGSGDGGGSSIDPSVLADYVTKDYLSQQGYLSSADMSNFVTESELNAAGYVTYSYLSSYTTRIDTLEDTVEELVTYNLPQRVYDVEEIAGWLNNKYYDLDSYMSSYNTRITSLENNMSSYGSDIAAIEAYLPILAYMQLCHDTDNNTYIRFTCPIVAMGDIVAFGWSFSWQ